jgi:hypothetical protein
LLKKIWKIFKWTVLILIALYGLLWLLSLKTYAPSYGVSFDYNNATYLDLDWKKTYLAILSELKPELIRISLKWDEVEGGEGVFDWSKSDYMLNEAAKRNIRATLVIGQKTPRWPECNEPSWTASLSKEDRAQEFLTYFETAINRYKDHKALELWQIENEPYILFPFGECTYFNKDLVEQELDMIKKLDSAHKTLITDSGELSIWIPAAFKGDFLGTTLYQRVRTPKGRVVSYSWLPPAFYKMRARILGVSYDELFIAELQAEPWLLKNDPKTASIEEINETLSLSIFKKNISYAKKVGASRAYLWGAEWWYFMKEKRNDPSFWNQAVEIFAKK